MIIKFAEPRTYKLEQLSAVGYMNPVHQTPYGDLFVICQVTLSGIRFNGVTYHGIIDIDGKYINVKTKQLDPQISRISTYFYSNTFDGITVTNIVGIWAERAYMLTEEILLQCHDGVVCTIPYETTLLDNKARYNKETEELELVVSAPDGYYLIRTKAFVMIDFDIKEKLFDFVVLKDKHFHLIYPGTIYFGNKTYRRKK